MRNPAMGRGRPRGSARARPIRPKKKHWGRIRRRVPLPIALPLRNSRVRCQDPVPGGSGPRLHAGHPWKDPELADIAASPHHQRPALAEATTGQPQARNGRAADRRDYVEWGRGWIRRDVRRAGCARRLSRRIWPCPCDPQARRSADPTKWNHATSRTALSAQAVTARYASSRAASA